MEIPSPGPKNDDPKPFSSCGPLLLNHVSTFPLTECLQCGNG
jgi:hypothetical protein